MPQTAKELEAHDDLGAAETQRLLTEMDALMARARILISDRQTRVAIITERVESETKSEPYIADDPVHFERFMDAARQLGVQESEDAFLKALRALLKLKPKRKDGGS